LKKNRKLRGKVSAGYGRVGRHRCHSSGRGKSGGQHHHKILFSKYHKGFFGKKGMRLFRLRKNHYKSYNLNVKNLIFFCNNKIIDSTNFRIKIKFINLSILSFKCKLLGKINNSVNFIKSFKYDTNIIILNSITKHLYSKMVLNNFVVFMTK
jgi:ribosomal protein L15